MGKRCLNPSNLPPTGGFFTQVVEGTGKKTLYIAGQVARDPSGKLVGKGDFAAQAKQALENLKRAVEAGGASLDDVVKLNTYVTDLSKLKDLYAVRSKYFSKEPPAATLVGVTGLADPDFLIEIEAIAVVP